MRLMSTLFFSLVVDAIFGTLLRHAGALFFKKNPPPVPRRCPRPASRRRSPRRARAPS